MMYIHSIGGTFRHSRKERGHNQASARFPYKTYKPLPHYLKEFVSYKDGGECSNITDRQTTLSMTLIRLTRASSVDDYLRSLEPPASSPRLKVYDTLHGKTFALLA